MTLAFDPEQIAILEVAATLFERYGYKKTTIEDIAQEAGIGKGSVYLRFASKEEIGIAWLGQIHKSLFDDLESDIKGQSPQDAIETWLTQRVMRRFDIFDRHCRSMDEALATLKPLVEEKKAAFHAREAALIAEKIREANPANEDPLGDAETMIVATNSLMPYSLRPAQLGDRDSVQRRAQALARLLVRAIEIR
jgi:AcrR family transcriptional regulator